MQLSLCLVGTVYQVIEETAGELSDLRRSIEHIIVTSNSNITIDAA